MKESYASSRRHQAGAANLLIALVLSMSVTLVTLAVAKTQLTERRISTNGQWHIRLSLESQSRWSNTIADLTENKNIKNWISDPDSKDSVYRQFFSSADRGMNSSVTISRSNKTGKLVGIQATSVRDDGSGLSASFSQTVRLLTVLSPVAESPPALIINGCITQASSDVHIRPVNSDTETAGESIRLTGAQSCPPLPEIDLHRGSINEQSFRETLWSTIFTVSVEEFTRMVESEQPLADEKRRYLTVHPTDLVNGRWTQSMGSPEHPVVLYFPPNIACPEFSPGTRIYGIVFVDSSCPDPIASVGFEIFGSFVINGDFNASGADIHLNHIQIADDNLTSLNFPVLRSVRIPGSWRDF